MHKQVPTNTRDPVAGPPSALPDSAYRAAPVMWKGHPGERCVVDRVMLTSNEEHALAVKVLVRHTRRPELGDKFSSRHGQKGVVGCIVSQVGWCGVWVGGWGLPLERAGRGGSRGRGSQARAAPQPPASLPLPASSLTTPPARLPPAGGHAV